MEKWSHEIMNMLNMENDQLKTIKRPFNPSIDPYCARYRVENQWSRHSLRGREPSGWLHLEGYQFDVPTFWGVPGDSMGALCEWM